MDGVGLRDDITGNAVAQAHLETLTDLMANHPWVPLAASGAAVGLAASDMGNSEVGHNAIGAGQIIPQGPARVQQAFDDGSVFQTDTWRDAISNVLDHQSTLHFMGIFSDGNVHSNIHQLTAMLAEAQKQGVTRARIHILTDGRDVPPQSEPKYINILEDFVKSLGSPDYKIASGGGRMAITADRYDNDWGMVERGWHTHVLGEGRQFTTAAEAVATYRREDPGVQDQYLPAFVITEDGQPVGTINDGDTVIYIDFRADRAVEIARAFTYDDFPHFDRVRYPRVYFAGMTEYDGDLHVPAHTLVTPTSINHTLGEYLAQHHVAQYAISETVKYGHITYYFNGNRYDKFDAATETYEQVPSDTLPFDTRPWMKSAEITDRLVAAITSGKYQFLRVNYPGGDMVGHFGELEPTITAMEAVDIALGRLRTAIDAVGGTMIVTADHGNAEELVDADGNPKTSHTTNPVPCIFYSAAGDLAKRFAVSDAPDLGLSNLAATITTLLDLPSDPVWRQPILQKK
jgi:2,3-bisphosphoglycerate-independent phosphoglycerate mutase